MPARWPARLLAAALFLGVGAPAWSQAEKPPAQTPGPAGVELRPGILESVAGVPQPEPPKSTIRLIRSQVKAPNLDVPAERHYEKLESNIWAVTELMGKKLSGYRRSLAWHGIVDLASTIEFGGPVRTGGVIPLGKLFIPFSSERSFSSQGFLNATSVTGDLAILALPRPGAVFSFEQKLEGRNTVTFTGFFGGPRTTDLKADRKNRCVVGEEADAATVSVHLRGRYLPVTCEGKDEVSNTSVTRKWAYLLDSNLYIVLSTVTAGGTETHEITAVEYAP
jgi:hypothetical protein